MSFRIWIAATRTDWLDLFAEVKEGDSLRFSLRYTSTLEEMTPVRLDELPNLGVSQTGLMAVPSYLAIPAIETILPEGIQLNNGGVRYFVDQNTNPDSFVFRPGGLWQNDCYIIGEITSLHKTGLCAQIAQRIRRVARKRFAYSGVYYAGPECRRLYAHCKFTHDWRGPDNCWSEGFK